jgi:signal transduction histidine kinase
MEYIYLIFLREIYKDCKDRRLLKKMYQYTVLSFPILFALFILLTLLHLKTDLVFFMGHIINGPFVSLVLFLNFNKRGFLAFIKYGMIVLFTCILITAVFSIRFNNGLNQSVFDSYPLLFVRIGMLIDIVLFQIALLQNWYDQGIQLSLEKLQTQLNAERIRSKLSAELHDDLGASLSGISMYSHLMKSQLNDSNSPALRSLEIIKDTANELVGKLSDIVWMTNPSEDSLKRLFQRLEEYAHQMASAKNIQVKVNFPDEGMAYDLPIEARRNVYLICKEAINNAVKYSTATMLELDIFQSKDRLNISISDNGRGFDSIKVKPGNGLANMVKRAEEIGADFKILTDINQGCKIILQIKIA